MLVHYKNRIRPVTCVLKLGNIVDLSLHTFKRAIESSRREYLKIIGLGLLYSGFAGAGCSNPLKPSETPPKPNANPSDPNEPVDMVDTSVESGDSDVIQVECPDSTLKIQLSEHPGLSTVGGSAYVSFPGELVHILVVCVGHQEWIGVWKICSHGSCDVEWTEELALIECPCHNSLFDWDGSIIRGPATQSLTSFDICLDDTGENLIVTRTE